MNFQIMELLDSIGGKLPVGTSKFSFAKQESLLKLLILSIAGVLGECVNVIFIYLLYWVFNV